MKKKMWGLSLLLAALLLFPGCSVLDDLIGDNDKEEPTKFVLPGQYITEFDEEGPSADDTLPAGKTAKFYCLSPATHASFLDGEGTFVSEFSFDGVTAAGGATVEHQIAGVYNNQQLYPFALIILDGSLSDTDFEGKTAAELFALATEEGQLGLGFIAGDEGDPQPFTASVKGGTVNLDLVDLKVFFEQIDAPGDGEGSAGIPVVFNFRAWYISGFGEDGPTDYTPLLSPADKTFQCYCLIPRVHQPWLDGAGTFISELSFSRRPRGGGRQYKYSF